MANPMICPLVFFACLHSLHACFFNCGTEELSQSLGGYDPEQGGYPNRVCSKEMMANDIKQPWLGIEARLQRLAAPFGDKSKKISNAECIKCGKALVDKGILPSNFKCQEKELQKFWWSETYQFIVVPKMTSVPSASDSGSMVPGESPLPAALQGVFWLPSDDVSLLDLGLPPGEALISFAPNGKQDCAWCSYGQLLNGKYLIRLAGNRVWSSATKPPADNAFLHFGLVGDQSNPKMMAALPVKFKGGGSWYANGWYVNKHSSTVKNRLIMTKLSASEASKLGYPGSVVWQWGQTSDKPFSQYHGAKVGYLIQVKDASNKPKDAWTKFQSAAGGSKPSGLFDSNLMTSERQETSQGRIGQETPQGRIAAPVSAFSPWLFATCGAILLAAGLSVLIVRRHRAAQAQPQADGFRPMYNAQDMDDMDPCMRIVDEAVAE